MQYTKYERNEDFYKKIIRLNLIEKKNAYQIAEELNIPWGSAVCAIRKAQIIAYYNKYGKLPEELIR